MKALILAGGGGSRLWPLSDNQTPKQFISFDGQYSLLQHTLIRCQQMGVFSELVVITNQAHLDLVKRHADMLELTLPIRVIAEPCRRNTAPAIALGVKALVEDSDSATVCVFPSDHCIPDSDWDHLKDKLMIGNRLANDGGIVTFGIVPTSPDTGYGYIQIETRLDAADGDQPGSFPVTQFVEKPGYETAVGYVESCRYLWNSGMFMFHTDTLLSELKQNAPEIDALFETMDYPQMLANFDRMPDISIDYAVMEKTRSAFVIPLSLSWSDLGSWDSLHQTFPQDESANVHLGVGAQNLISLDSKNNMVMSSTTHRQIALLGMEDMILVDTPDATLVARRGESQRVREVLAAINQRRASAPNQHVASDWGHRSMLWKRLGDHTRMPLQMLSLSIKPHQQMMLPARDQTSRDLHVVVTAGRLFLPETRQWIAAGENVVIRNGCRVETAEEPVELCQMIVDEEDAMYWDTVQSVVRPLETTL